MQDKANDLEDRLVDFAVRIIGVVEALPDTKAEITLPGSWFDREPHRHQTTAKPKARNRGTISFTR